MRAVHTGVRSWYVSNGSGVGSAAPVSGEPAGSGESVNESECDGTWFLSAATTRPNSDGCAVGTCASECGVRTKRVMGAAGGIDASRSCTLRGEGGCTRTAGLLGGVGGYECGAGSVASVASESVEVFGNAEEPAAVPGYLGGAFVRQENDRAASAWYGDDCGSGVRAICIPGGNDGARMWMYHPRFGRCIDHCRVDVAFSCSP